MRFLICNLRLGFRILIRKIGNWKLEIGNPSRSDGDHAARRRELDGVREEADSDLPDPVAVGVEDGEVRRDEGVNGEPLLAHRLSCRLQDFRDDLREVHFRQVERQLFRFGRVQVQDLVDDG